MGEEIEDASFQCFNCSKHFAESDRGWIPVIGLAAAALAFLVIARDLRWPSNVCSGCVGQVYLFAGLTAVFLAVVILVAAFA